MKLVKSEIVKKGSKAVLMAAFRNHMREARRVRVVIEPASDYNMAPVVEFEDKAHLTSFLNGMAEIAWACGWRPRGLVNTLAHVAQNYKEPAEDK